MHFPRHCKVRYSSDIPKTKLFSFLEEVTQLFIETRNKKEGLKRKIRPKLKIIIEQIIVATNLPMTS